MELRHRFLVGIGFPGLSDGPVIPRREGNTQSAEAEVSEVSEGARGEPVPGVELFGVLERGGNGERSDEAVGCARIPK